MVSTAVPEIADDEHAVLPVLQNASAGPEEISEGGHEVAVSGNIREVARVLAVAGLETTAHPQLAYFMIRSFVQDSPVRWAGDDEVDGISRQIADQNARVAMVHNLRSLIPNGQWHLAAEPLLSQFDKSSIQFHANAVSPLKCARLEC